MGPSKPHSWRIAISAKSRGFDLRLRATNVLPHWGNGGERISVFLRLWRLVLNVRSENRAPARRRTPGSKLLRFLGKVFRPWRRRRDVKNNAGSAKAPASRNPRIGFTPSDGGRSFLRVIFSSILQHTGRNWMICLIVLAFLPLFSSKFCRHILFKGIKLALKGAPVSISNLLFA